MIWVQYALLHCAFEHAARSIAYLHRQAISLIVCGSSARFGIFLFFSLSILKQDKFRYKKSDKTELVRRRFVLLMYLLRSPCYDRYTRYVREPVHLWDALFQGVLLLMYRLGVQCKIEFNKRSRLFNLVNNLWALAKYNIQTRKYI